jgi:hypothetical protein
LDGYAFELPNAPCASRLRLLFEFKICRPPLIDIQAVRAFFAV